MKSLPRPTTISRSLSYGLLANWLGKSADSKFPYHQVIYQYFSNPALVFAAVPALAPAEVQVDSVLIEQYNRELTDV